jgi:hypothetical protein
LGARMSGRYVQVPGTGAYEKSRQERELRKRAHEKQRLAELRAAQEEARLRLEEFSRTPEFQLAAAAAHELCRAATSEPAAMERLLDVAVALGRVPDTGDQPRQVANSLVAAAVHIGTQLVALMQTPWDWRRLAGEGSGRRGRGRPPSAKKTALATFAAVVGWDAVAARGQARLRDLVSEMAQRSLGGRPHPSPRMRKEEVREALLDRAARRRTHIVNGLIMAGASLRSVRRARGHD